MFGQIKKRRHKFVTICAKYYIRKWHKSQYDLPRRFDRCGARIV